MIQKTLFTYKSWDKNVVEESIMLILLFRSLASVESPDWIAYPEPFLINRVLENRYPCAAN